MYFLDPSLQIPINHGWSLIVAMVVVTGLNNTLVMPPTLSITQVQHLPCSLAIPSPCSQPITADYSQRSSDSLHTWLGMGWTTPMVGTPEEMCGLLSIKIIN